MNDPEIFDPQMDFSIERFIDAPLHLVWQALTRPEHLREWYMPRQWGRVSHAELDLRPGGIVRIDIAVDGGADAPNVGCVLEVLPQQRLVWTSMLFPGFRPAVFDDIPITAIMAMQAENGGTRYRFTALHRNAGELATNRESGFHEGTRIAIEQFAELAQSLR